MRLSFLVNEVRDGLRRNVTMTIAMILTVAISLTMLGGGLLAWRMAKKTQDTFLSRVEVRLYLTDDISANDPACSQDLCASLRAALSQTPGVESVDFLSRPAAVKEAKEKTFADQPAMAQIIDDNALPASLTVKLTDPDDYSEIFDRFHDRAGVLNVHNDRDIVDRLTSIFSGVRNTAFGLAVVQALAALLLIANMVQIAAYTRRTEVAIMRLVGATRWYTQLPFLIEAVVAALAGALLAMVGLFAAKPLALDSTLGHVFPVIGWGDIALICLALTPVGILFAAATAYATLRYYVREETN
jgi:cell division transport system permease protein